MSTAVIVVPPLLKYAAGPLLGPAMLAGAAERAGHVARVLDLNSRYLAERLPTSRCAPSAFTGDHDKPAEALRAIDAEWKSTLRTLLPPAPALRRVGDAIASAAFDCDAIERAALALAASKDGRWISAHLEQERRPDLVGVSVLFAGQVFWGLAVTVLARRMWPGVPVLWGGAHVTALRNVVGTTARLGRFVDGFVFGYAEASFVRVLDALSARKPMPADVAVAGCLPKALAQGDPSVAPSFGDLSVHKFSRLTLPAQASRGCAYSRCAFCTYPAIEGTYRPLDLGQVEPTIDLAVRAGAVISFKDSLVLPDRLEAIAALVAGRVRWSACTKLHPRLATSLLNELSAAGCDTLEVGLETLVPESQALIEKRQEEALFAHVVEAAAAANIALVVNYMTGFPREDEAEATAFKNRAEATLLRAGGRSRLELNVFQLERLAPMAASPERFGLRIAGEWPWSSVLDWEPVESSRSSARRLPVVDRPAEPGPPRTSSAGASRGLGDPGLLGSP